MASDPQSIRRRIQDRMEAAAKRVREDPQDPIGHWMLGITYVSTSHWMKDPDQSIACFKLAWDAFNAAIAVSPPINQFADDWTPTVAAMVERAKAAYSAGDKEAAGRFSRDLLDAIAGLREDGVGNAVFYGNHLLGLIALEQGRIEIGRAHV